MSGKIQIPVGKNGPIKCMKNRDFAVYIYCVCVSVLIASQQMHSLEACWTRYTSRQQSP